MLLCQKFRLMPDITKYNIMYQPLCSRPNSQHNQHYYLTRSPPDCGWKCYTVIPSVNMENFDKIGAYGRRSISQTGGRWPLAARSGIEWHALKRWLDSKVSKVLLHHWEDFLPWHPFKVCQVWPYNGLFTKHTNKVKTWHCHSPANVIYEFKMGA